MEDASSKRIYEAVVERRKGLQQISFNEICLYFIVAFLLLEIFKIIQNLNYLKALLIIATSKTLYSQPNLARSTIKRFISKYKVKIKITH